MSEVIVCAEPETKDEAARFILALGAHPHARSMRSSWKPLRKAHDLLVYLKGAEPSSTLRTCLKQISREKALNVVIYSAETNEHRAAELGKIVGQLRPNRTHICFRSEEVRDMLHLRRGPGKSPALQKGSGESNASESAARLRKELKLTQVDVASSLGVTARTIQNWEARKSAPPRRLRDLRELRDLLTKYFEGAQVCAWMDSPNEAFQGHTPRKMIREGKTRDLILEFCRMQSGEPL